MAALLCRATEAQERIRGEYLRSVPLRIQHLLHLSGVCTKACICLHGPASSWVGPKGLHYLSEVCQMVLCSLQGPESMMDQEYTFTHVQVILPSCAVKTVKPSAIFHCILSNVRGKMVPARILTSV